MESILRITRAQPMDALSSQATVAGYKAVLLAADRMPRFFPMLMTAAGTIPPAKVLVLGAGVAGLQAVRAMRPGSVIVDLAADTGGNCELTLPGEEIVEHGVAVIGSTNVPSTMPAHASQLLSRNIASLLGLLVADGAVSLDWSDEIVAGTCVTRREAAA